VKILGIDPVVTRGMLDEIVSALLGEPLVLGEGQAIEPPEEEFEGEQQDKDDRYGNSNLKHGKALLRVCGRTPPHARATPAGYARTKNKS